MTFPTIPTVAGGRVLFQLSTNPAGTHTSPSLSSLTKNSGDLLIAIVLTYIGGSTNAEFSSWGGGFTEFADRSGTTVMAIGCAYKWSDGTETGTFTVTTVDTSANDSCFILLSIPGAHASTPPEASGKFNGSSTAADPTSFDPNNWAAEDTLWIAVAGSAETATTGSYTGIASAPANYSDYADSGISADVVGGVEGAVAFRQLNAASEDVGTFSVDTSNARNSALLIAVRPAPPAATEFTPSPVAATLAVTAPTIVLTYDISPAPVAAIPAVPAPTLGLVYTISPAPVAAATGVPAPTVTFDQAFTPAPVPVTLVVPSPSLATSLSLSPDPIPAILTVPAPSMGNIYTMAPTPIAVTLTVTSPTLDTPYAIAPTPIPVTLAVPSQTLGTVYTLTPGPVPIILTVTDSQVSGPSGDIYLTPGPVAVSLTVPPVLLTGYISTGSDLQWVLDCIAFWFLYDSLSDEDERRALHETFLLNHGLDMARRKIGFFPPRITNPWS